MMDDFDMISVPVGVEFYLKHRDEPLFVNAMTQVSQIIIEKGMKPFMDATRDSVLAELDSVQAHWVTFKDDRNNIRVVMLDQIQSISILIPDELPELE